MVYLQILLLLLVVLTQVFRPDAIARWDRLRKTKLHLLISLGIEPVLMLLSRLGIVSSNYPGVMPWSAALEGIFFVVAASFYLFCLRTARSAESNPSA